MQNKRKIMILDDEAINIRLIMSVLGNEYDYETVQNGFEAVNKILTVQPDLVFLDILIPGINGIDICKLMKEHPSLSGTPIVLMTASTDETLRYEGLLAGASDFLTKPINSLETKIKTANLLKLKEYHDLLETKVKQRTEELANRYDELSASEEQFAKVFYANPHIMFVISEVGHRYYMVNDEFLKATGSNKEIIGRPVDTIELITSPFKGEVIQTLIDKSTIRNMEIRFQLKFGKERDGLLSGEIIDLLGARYYLFTITDITEHKHIELVKEMARLERLNLVGQIAASIGHEIRNPITTTRGFLQLLKHKKESANHLGYFNIMIEELDRANKIITDFLSITKNKQVKKEPKSLQTVIEALQYLLDANAIFMGKNILYEIRQCPDVMLDESEIRQMLLNFVQNGLEAMVPGGTLKIMLYPEEQDVVLAVKDQGKGIHLGIIKELGTPFLTTKEEGTGLGLTVCYSIAEHHNAKIQVESNNTGTVFYIRFPMYKYRNILSVV